MHDKTNCSSYHFFTTWCFALLTFSCAFILPTSAYALRIKEVAAVEGVRTNQLTGFGLVVGLDGTGDQTTQTPFTTQSIINMLAQLGTTLPTTRTVPATGW